MTQIVRLLVVAATVMSFATGVSVAGSDWVLLDKDESHSNFYFDKGSVKKLPVGIYSFQVKVVYTPDGKKDVVETLGSSYRDIAYSLYDYDLNCDSQQTRFMKVVHINATGSVIKQIDMAGVTPWEDLPARTRLDLVQELVCPQ